MKTLREAIKDNPDSDLKDKINDKFKAIYSELLDVEVGYSLEYVDWFLEQIVQNKHHFEETSLNIETKKLRGKTDNESINRIAEIKKRRKKILPKNYPSSLIKGDIIYIKFGIGLGDELTNGHYGIILNRKGALFLIAPLSSTPQPYGELNIHFENLGLPGEDSDGSYVKFDHIRYIHYRRIENINGIKEGRIHIGRPIADKILENSYKLNKTE